MLDSLPKVSVKYPKLTVALYIFVTLLLGIQIKNFHIDTDPENMLKADEPVRVFHDQVKKDFGMNDMIILGIVRDDGVLRSDTLSRMSRVIEHIKDIEGVISEDIVSFTTSDTIESSGFGLDIHPIMEEVPQDADGLAKLKKTVFENPMLKNKLISNDGEGVAIYIPIEKKDLSYAISRQIEEFIKPFEKEAKEKYYFAGLPVAEDTFGHDMFVQMGISAPLAMVVIFLIMLYFFKRVSLVTISMCVAMISVITTMGLLVGMGYTLHIMTSMIPIFLMPISVIDSTHILSEFREKYAELKDRKQTILKVLAHLSKPMFYTSITSAVGFASLATTPIPPVKVFGIFVAFGIMVAWFATVTLIPATIMFVSEKGLTKSFKMEEMKGKENGFLIKGMSLLYSLSTNHFKLVSVVIVLLVLFSGIGINKIVINDNPVNWFKADEKIAVADRVMNEHFSGTYMANLIFMSDEAESMKRPKIAKYIATLQDHLDHYPLVGKTTGYTDIIKRVNHAVHDFDGKHSIVPDSKEELSQYLFLFQNSGDPEDLEKFVDFDFQNSNLWIQMKKGDNIDMLGVVEEVQSYIAKNPLPDGVTVDWAGLTYLNIVWQEKMVKGMLTALGGSFIVVFILMVILFRSLKYGILSMAPLSLTIGVTYGFLGFIGKNYDMPVAVLSSLTLGLSVDFAIHFIERFREAIHSSRNTKEAIKMVFEAPARAIARNALVIAVGFTPLLISPLVPYITVGVLLAIIMLLSTVATLIFLPSLLLLWPGAQTD